MRRLLVVLVALGLAACSAPLPTPEPDALPAIRPPALSTEQVSELLADLTVTLARADAESDPELLEPRAFGPAAEIRRAEYALAEAGATDAITEIPAAAQTLVVPTLGEWPRAIMVVTEAPSDLQAPLLLTLVQTEPRASYRLWAWARLFPGIEMPPTAQPEVGSPMVTAEDEALAAPPTDVLDRYVDVLENGSESEYAEQFVPDELRERIAEIEKAWTELIGRNGKLTQTYTVVESGPFSVATAEGGALVVGVFETTTTITLSDSTLTIGDQTAALVGDDTLTSRLVLNWHSVVVFEVPPEGSAEPVEVLGAEHALSEASGR